MASTLSRPQCVNTWLQWIGQRQLQDKMRIIEFGDLVHLLLEVWQHLQIEIEINIVQSQAMS